MKTDERLVSITLKIKLSQDEWLRNASIETRIPMSELMREAIDELRQKYRSRTGF